MTNKVMNSWSFGGVNLSSFGFVTELSSHLDIPIKRGENVQIPFVDGRVHVSKLFEQKTVSFGIEILAKQICDLETTFDTMKQLFGARAQQYLMYNSPTGARRALAEMTGQLGVIQDIDPLAVKITVDFLLAEPFFRSTELYSYEVTIDASPHAFDPVNSGTGEERTAVITFTGPSGHPKLEHIASGVYVQYDEDILAGDTVVVDCGHYTAVHTHDGNVINHIVHYGDPTFMVLLPGANHLHVTDATAATGKVKIEFYPPYL
jgi:hypothetical protein